VKRIAFIFQHNEGWLGGLNYFRNLISAIDGLTNRKIEAVIFVSNDTPEQQLAGLPKTEIVRSRLLNNDSLFMTMRQWSWRLFPHDIILERLLLKHKINVMSHSGSLGRDSRIPSIGWIPDFQHFYLPEFYKGDEISRRTVENRYVCMQSNVVLLSSYDAQKDLKRFFPEFAAKSKVLQFVANVEFDESRTSGEELQQKYGFKGSFFLVANQFWAHKNHMVVIEALHNLRKNGREMLVLATGNTHDHRQPEFFQALLNRVKELNVEDCFKVLGVVPKADLMGLMHDTVALINPSLFEGWSSGVEEAKSLGKRIILSDIAVHQEQDPPGALFFPPSDAHALAVAMSKMISGNDPVRNHEMMMKAREALPQRRQDFARAYQDIVIGVTGS
jgi:glycosyltransferase involved in cell wall biosynthesis